MPPSARMLVSMLLLVAAGSGASCARKTPAPAKPAAAAAEVEPAAPTCEEAAEHVVVVISESPEIKDLDDEARQKAESMLKDLEAETVKECVDKAWDAPLRRCVAEMKQMDDMQRCADRSIVVEGKPGKTPLADKSDEAKTGDIPAPRDVKQVPADATITESGLASKVLQKGTGAQKPQFLDKVKVHYTGWTTDGKMFDSSVKRGEPAVFPLRVVIPGWTEGLQLMVVGEKRRFWIPKELAYDDQPGKPAGMLVFDVELLEIIPGPPPVPAPADVAAVPAGATRSKSGLAWKISKKGTGKVHPSPKAFATFHFTAWDTSGLMLQSTVPQQRPLTIPVDKGIQAWVEVLPQMVAGEKRLIWSPDELAFKGRPGAKPGDLTVFELELISFIEPPKAPPDVAKPPRSAEKTASGLYSKRLSKGKGGVHPAVGDIVEVHYNGWTTDGKLFDSSITRGKPARFPLKDIIAGWTEGVQLMVVGEKRRFWIPEELAYKGAQGAPAGMLVFDIELLAINPPESR